MARFEYVTDPGSRAWWKAVEFQRKRQQLDGGTKETCMLEFRHCRAYKYASAREFIGPHRGGQSERGVCGVRGWYVDPDVTSAYDELAKARQRLKAAERWAATRASRSVPVFRVEVFGVPVLRFLDRSVDTQAVEAEEPGPLDDARNKLETAQAEWDRLLFPSSPSVKKSAG